VCLIRGEREKRNRRRRLEIRGKQTADFGSFGRAKIKKWYCRAPINTGRDSKNYPENSEVTIRAGGIV